MPPITIDPTVPQGSEAETLGASRIRNIATWLQQMFGGAGSTALTYALAPFTVDQVTGLVTVQGNPTTGLGIATKQYADQAGAGLPIVLTGSGSFFTLASIATYRVILIGGGGGGAGSHATGPGGGGGAGAMTIALVVGGGAGYFYSVGSGGAPGVNSTGGSGAATTWTDSFPNSVVGAGGAGATFPGGGVGGTASGTGLLDGDVFILQAFAGIAGAVGIGAVGGSGAPSFNNLGSGGTGGNTNAVATAGTAGTIIVIPGG